MEINEKFCPVCKNINKRGALTCVHCGALLENHHSSSSATTKDADMMMKVKTKPADLSIDDSAIPDGDLAIYTEGMTKPVYLYIERELVLGRKELDMDDSFNDGILNLSELGGYQMGISRQHAMIRRVETGYELIDLASTNGSWLNEERLVPNKSYPLANGSQLRFGRMRMFVRYHSVSKTKIIR